MHYNTIIIGAGPAGLFAAQMLGQSNKKILLLERNNQAGKKLLLAGSGQCNFTHTGEMHHFIGCYGEHGKFLNKAFSLLTNKQTRAFFEEVGVTSYAMPNGKVFPKSMCSQDILAGLLLRCNRSSVTMEYNVLVKRIDLYDNVFTVESEAGERYFADHIVIATGGKSYPKTGSDGIGYELAKSLGHTIIEPKPALTYVTIQEKVFAELSGIAFEEVELVIWRDKKKVKSGKGSILFTHKGLSGPAILDYSRYIEQGDTLTVNFMYPKTYEQAKKQFADEVGRRGKEEILTFLKNQGLPKNFCQVICQISKVDEHISCARLSKENREVIVNALTQCECSVSGLGGFHVAMATSGGVKLKEVNPSTMESRKQKGLYFIGEVLDIDGNTGGYNIQAAFSTAYVCAKHIGTKSKKEAFL